MDKFITSKIEEFIKFSKYDQASLYDEIAINSGSIQFKTSDSKTFDDPSINREIYAIECKILEKYSSENNFGRAGDVGNNMWNFELENSILKDYKNDPSSLDPLLDSLDKQQSVQAVLETASILCAVFSNYAAIIDSTKYPQYAKYKEKEWQEASTEAISKIQNRATEVIKEKIESFRQELTEEIKIAIEGCSATADLEKILGQDFFKKINAEAKKTDESITAQLKDVESSITSDIDQVFKEIGEKIDLYSVTNPFELNGIARGALQVIGNDIKNEETTFKNNCVAELKKATKRQETFTDVIVDKINETHNGLLDNYDAEKDELLTFVDDLGEEFLGNHGITGADLSTIKHILSQEEKVKKIIEGEFSNAQVNAILKEYFLTKKYLSYIRQGVSGFTTVENVKTLDKSDILLNKGQQIAIATLQAALSDGAKQGSTVYLALPPGSGKTAFTSSIEGGDNAKKFDAFNSEGKPIYNGITLKEALGLEASTFFINHLMTNDEIDKKIKHIKAQLLTEKVILFADEYHLLAKENQKKIKELVKDNKSGKIILAQTSATLYPVEAYYANNRRISKDESLKTDKEYYEKQGKALGKIAKSLKDKQPNTLEEFFKQNNDKRNKLIIDNNQSIGGKEESLDANHEKLLRENKEDVFVYPVFNDDSSNLITKAFFIKDGSIDFRVIDKAPNNIKWDEQVDFKDKNFNFIYPNKPHDNSGKRALGTGGDFGIQINASSSATYIQGPLKNPTDAMQVICRDRNTDALNPSLSSVSGDDYCINSAKNWTPDIIKDDIMSNAESFIENKIQLAKEEKKIKKPENIYALLYNIIDKNKKFVLDNKIRGASREYCMAMALNSYINDAYIFFEDPAEHQEFRKKILTKVFEKSKGHNLPIASVTDDLKGDEKIYHKQDGKFCLQDGEEFGKGKEKSKQASYKDLIRIDDIVNKDKKELKDKDDIKDNICNESIIKENKAGKTFTLIENVAQNEHDSKGRLLILEHDANKKDNVFHFTDHKILDNNIKIKQVQGIDHNNDIIEGLKKKLSDKFRPLMMPMPMPDPTDELAERHQETLIVLNEGEDSPVDLTSFKFNTDGKMVNINWNIPNNLNDFNFDNNKIFIKPHGYDAADFYMCISITKEAEDITIKVEDKIYQPVEGGGYKESVPDYDYDKEDEKEFDNAKKQMQVLATATQANVIGNSTVFKKGIAYYNGEQKDINVYKVAKNVDSDEVAEKISNMLKSSLTEDKFMEFNEIFNDVKIVKTSFGEKKIAKLKNKIADEFSNSDKLVESLQKIKDYINNDTVESKIITNIISDYNELDDNVKNKVLLGIVNNLNTHLDEESKKQNKIAKGTIVGVSNVKKPSPNIVPTSAQEAAKNMVNAMGTLSI